MICKLSTWHSNEKGNIVSDTTQTFFSLDNKRNFQRITWPRKFSHSPLISAKKVMYTERDDHKLEKSMNKLGLLDNFNSFEDSSLSLSSLKIYTSSFCHSWSTNPPNAKMKLLMELLKNID